jgi:hypothetical protein
VAPAVDPSDASLRRLAVDAMVENPTEPFGVYLFRSDEPGADLARRVEQEVFLEVFGNTPELLTKEYEPYEAASFFVCVVDHGRRLPAGVMRILVPSPAGFKTVNDIPPIWTESLDEMAGRTGLALDYAKTWDIATLAVASDYRGKAKAGLVTMGLYQALSMLTLRSGIEWLIAILDRRVFRMVRWQLRMTFADFKDVPVLPYLGSAASLPVWCSMSQGKRYLIAKDPELYELLVEGKGLEVAVRPLDMDSALKSVTLLSEIARRQDGDVMAQPQREAVSNESSPCQKVSMTWGNRSARTGRE